MKVLEEKLSEVKKHQSATGHPDELLRDGGRSKNLDWTPFPPALLSEEIVVLTLFSLWCSSIFSSMPAHGSIPDRLGLDALEGVTDAPEGVASPERGVAFGGCVGVKMPE